MKSHSITLILLILSVYSVKGQKSKSPANIDAAIIALDRDCPDSLKLQIKHTGDDSLIKLIFPWGGNYETISNWTSGDSPSKLEKYYEKLGITNISHIEKIVLLSYKAHLNNDSVRHEEIIRPFQILEKKWQTEDKSRLTIDSLRGIYIPKDLEDCFKQIDNFWSDSTKAQVKKWTEDEFTSRVHFGFGMWMRNNWQLWGGSRLSHYFNDMKVYHPDDMSGIILTSYHRHLNGKDIQLEEQIKVYQEYWQKMQEIKKKK